MFKIPFGFSPSQFASVANVVYPHVYQLFVECVNVLSSAST